MQDKPAFYCYLNWHWIFPAGLSLSHGVVVLRQCQRQNREEVGWWSLGGVGMVLKWCFYPFAIGRLLTGPWQPFPSSNGLGRRFGPGLSEAPSWIVCCKVSACVLTLALFFMFHLKTSEQGKLGQMDFFKKIYQSARFAGGWGNFWSKIKRSKFSTNAHQGFQ